MKTRVIVLIFFVLFNLLVCLGLATSANTNFPEILSWKNLRVVGKENGPVSELEETSSVVSTDIPSEWENSQLRSWVRISFRVGKIPSTKLQNRDPEREKIHAVESGLRVGRIPQQSVMDAGRRICVATSK